jgi:hypothetical protein
MFVAIAQNWCRNVKSMLSIEFMGLTHSVHRFIHSFVDSKVFLKINRNFLLIVV